MKNPRIHVTLPEDLADAIGTIAHLSDMSKSSLISSILSEQRSLIIQLADLLVEAREVSEHLPLSAKLTIDVQSGRIFKSEDEIRNALDAIHILISDYRNGREGGERSGVSTSVHRTRRPLAINKGARIDVDKGAKPKLSGAWKDI